MAPKRSRRREAPRDVGRRHVLGDWLCDVTLVYEAPAPEETEPEDPDQLPEPEYSQSDSAIEIPIEAHPRFKFFATPANGAIFGPPIPPLLQGDFKGWTKDSPYAGFLSYKVGSVTESVTTYFWSRPPGVEGLVGTVSGNWLTVSGSIQRKGIYWARTINRLYSTKRDRAAFEKAEASRPAPVVAKESSDDSAYGGKPAFHNSPWSGELTVPSAVSRAIKLSLKDPDSFQPRELLSLEKSTKNGINCYKAVFTFCAKNSFGGFTLGTATAHVRGSDLLGITVDQD